MKIYSLYVILSVNESKNILCLSASKINTELPIIPIVSSRYVNDEARYHIRKFFSSTEFIVNEQCHYGYFDIQNQFSMNYIADKNKDFNLENDIVITYGGISPYNKLSENYFWNKLKYNEEYKGYFKDSNLNLLISYISDKIII